MPIICNLVCLQDVGQVSIYKATNKTLNIILNELQFWREIIDLPRGKMAIINDENVNITNKIALFSSNLWPKWRFPNDSLAEERRITGNDHFKRMQFEFAIDSYNECIYYSTSMVFRGIAYANRAAAYLGLRRYQDCIDSVFLAKDCPLPAKIMKKVLAREKMAIEGLQLEEVTRGANDTEIPFELSYRHNKRLPSFVFCLNLKEAGNPYGGIVTTKDLLPGDILVIEPPLTTFTRSPNMCNNCLRNCGTLQPCKCGVMFCSAKCQKEAFDTYHNFECPLADHLRPFSHEDCLMLRVFFKLIQRFEDFASFREYLESIKAPNPFGVDDFKAWPNVGSFEAQFRLYYATEVPSVKNCTVRKRNLFRSDDLFANAQTSMAKTAIIIDILKLSKNIPSVATGSDDWAFLSEQLFRLFFYKTFTAKAVASSVYEYVHDADIGMLMLITSHIKNALALYGSASLFKTSCEANVDMEFRDNVLIVRAKACIPRGSELLAQSL